MKTTLSFILYTVWYIGGVCPAPAATYYVLPGESIQEAIDGASDGDRIEVSPATYTEAIDFKGKAVRLYSSNGPEHTTIDGTGHWHVVQCVSGEDPNTILEGFTITGGDANGAGLPEDSGGGMLNDSSSPTVIGCTFTGNTAYYGGGMFNRHSSPVVTGCTFSGNWAKIFRGSRGGGMLNYESSPTVTGCTFSGNWAESGGGMNNESSSPTVTDCIFSSNNAYSEGFGFGGGYGISSGGGMQNSLSAPIVNRCTFIGNWATVYYEGRSQGGGMGNLNSSPMVTSCIFSGNAAGYGGGMNNLLFSSPTVIGCTFSGNAAELIGGGLLNASDPPTNPIVTNCIFWGNGPNEIDNFESNLTVTYSDVQGGKGQPWFGTGCIDAVPLFVDPNGPDGAAGTADDNLHLLPWSPCIDAGDPAGDYSGQTDMDGRDRVLYDGVDMGADEVFPIAGDTDEDGDVDLVDFAYFAGHWLKGK